MSRILRRPMFKMGGSTNSGIMTGLVDRKGYAEDTGIKSRVVAKSARDYISEFNPLLQEFTPKTRLPLGAVGAALVSGTPMKDALISGYTDFTKRDDARTAGIQKGAVQLGLGQALKDMTPSTNVLKNRKTAIVNIKAQGLSLTEENIIKETARLNKLDEVGKAPNIQREIFGREKELRTIDGLPQEQAKRLANFEYVVGPKLQQNLNAQKIEKTIQGRIKFKDGQYVTRNKAPGIYFEPKTGNIVEITNELEVIENPPDILALL